MSFSKTVAQNLVLNGSFEDTINCPNNGFISNSQGWQPYSSSPDYFNSCVSSWYVYSVPSNLHGLQSPASGQAYSGIYTYVEGETDYSLNREILGNSLTSPLTIGQKYYVSLKVSLGTNTQNTGHSLASNKLGALFSTIPYSNIDSTTIPPIGNFAHVYTDSIITDTVNWTTIFGTFFADSAYTYISIGNFFQATNTDTIHVVNNNPFIHNAYYYVDDICVSTDSSFCANFVYIGVENEAIINQITIYPNPSSNLVKIEFSDNESHIVKICNSFGQIVIIRNIVEEDIVNMDSFPEGIYFIQTNVAEKTLVKKLIIY
jgi:hypothetical protein